MRAARVVEADLLVYRRAWRGSMIVSFVSPLLFLASMGIGLGSLVQHGAGGVAGQSYLDFIAPGLLVATAMQTGVLETSYPIMRKIIWDRLYDAMLATPLRVDDIVLGEIGFLSLRLLQVSFVFLVVMVLFGAVRSPEAVVAIPAAVLTGLAFGLPMIAYDAIQRGDAGFAAINRFLVLPLFLLSGTFFPINKLPGVFQALAWLLPLAHGTALARGLTLGSLGLSEALLHLGVLLAYATAGLWLARRLLQRRLTP